MGKRERGRDPRDFRNYTTEKKLTKIQTDFLQQKKSGKI
jgi:hypothetical protein